MLRHFRLCRFRLCFVELPHFGLCRVKLCRFGLLRFEYQRRQLLHVELRHFVDLDGSGYRRRRDVKLDGRRELMGPGDGGRRRRAREQLGRNLRHDLVEWEQQRSVRQPPFDLRVREHQLVARKLIGHDLPLHRRDALREVRQDETSRNEERDAGPERVAQALPTTGEHLDGQLIRDPAERHADHRLC